MVAHNIAQALPNGGSLLGGMMFERFTDRARRVVVLAQDEARAMPHDYIGTEHILLGIIHEGESVGAQALMKCGLSLGQLRTEVDRLRPEKIKPSGHIPFTPRAKKVLEYALREALQLGHNYIGTEHILLGLIREGDGFAIQAVKNLGVDPPAIKRAVITELNGYTEPSVQMLELTLGRVAQRISADDVQCAVEWFDDGEPGEPANDGARRVFSVLRHWLDLNVPPDSKPA